MSRVVGVGVVHRRLLRRQVEEVEAVLVEAVVEVVVDFPVYRERQL